jgi:hypothetical protein
MNIQSVLLIAAMGLISTTVTAQDRDLAAVESRDAATGFVGSMQFTVGRIARDCLASLGRTESPQAFVEAWLLRNGKYAAAASAHVEQRMNEAEAKGEGAKNLVLREIAAVRGEAERGIHSLYERNGKEVVCKRMVALIESGGYDVTPRLPMFNEIEALLMWAQKR